ncbi:right-handed parallel beta-helix repeat-containing protein [Pseudomonas sp. zjy_11]|uniref:right-handed parallel beta-helix repeat-containing protein n=1 Tax=unclassified Pseudomonas TaxID=196821 RepID=UPI00370AFFFB
MRLYFLLVISLSMMVGSSVAGAVECNLPSSFSGNVRLESNCVYNASIVISDSDTVLDCLGGTLDGGGALKTGIQINGRGKKISNVVIRNCRLVNFVGRGIDVTSGIPKWSLSKDIEKNYSVSPENIVIDNVSVAGGRGGVYFDSYVADSVLKNSVVRGADKVGVYLEQGSKGISILGNKIIENGVSGRREGVAIDSSANNLIKGNVFYGNGAGGVFLYKNCGENFKSGKSVLRWQSSDHNRIINNIFRSQPVGVWVASRQSRDLSKWGCGDPAVDDQGRFYKDFANNNFIELNEFCDVRVPVRVEGDNNYVARNKFGKIVSSAIEEPFRDRAKPDGVVTIGNTFEANSSAACQ